MSGIKISPKHGLNPCIPVCAFCGKEKNEIALLGKLKDDAKAPMSAIMNYEPCNECRANWSKGIALIRTATAPPVKDMPPIQKHDEKNLYPTGSYMVVTKDAAKRLFGIDASEGTFILMEDTAFDDFQNKCKEVIQEGEE